MSFPPDHRRVLALRAFSVQITGLAGAAPLPNGGWRLDMADGTSRTATQAEGDAALAWADARMAEATADQSDTTAVRSDASVRALLLMTPAQIDSWAASNITSLTGARAAIVLIAKALSVIARAMVR